MKPKWHFILTSTYISIFWGNFCLFLLDYKLLSSIFSLLFGFFCEFQCLLQKNTFILGIFYFILAWKSLKAIKSKCIYFSLPTSHKSAIKSNPLMQLDSIFYKTVNKNKLRVWKLQSVNCNWSGSGMGGFILLSLFSSVFERARKHQLSSIYNTKLTSNINKITTSFI